MTAVTPDDVLAHFGVKGMKWGVRKEDPTNPRSSKELVKAAKANWKVQSGPILESRFDRAFFNTEIKYSELSNKATTIKAGHEFYRLTKYKDEPARDMLYVSTSKADRDRYRVALSRRNILVASQHYRRSNYEVAYKSLVALKSPSEKERVDAFINLMDADIPVGKRGKTVKGRKLLEMSGAGKISKKIDNQRIGEKYYTSFTEGQFQSTPLNSAYFNAVRARGYNAIVDDNDLNIVARQPLMVLNPGGDIKKLNVKRLSNDDINNAIKNFVAVQNE